MPQKPPASEMREEILSLRPIMRRAVFFSILTSLMSLAPMLYMLEVYDRVVNSRSYTTLLMLTVLVVGVYLMSGLLDWVRAQVARHAGVQLDQRLCQRVFDAAFETSLRNPASAGAQALSDLRTLRDFLATPALLTLLELPVALLFLILVFWMHPHLGAFALIGGLVQLLLAILLERRSRPALMEANRAHNQAISYADGSLRNAEVLESMGMLKGIHARWLQRQSRFLQLQATASDYAGTMSSISKSLLMVQRSALLGLGCWLILLGEMEGGGGKMLMGAILGGMILQPLVQVITNWSQVINVRDAYARLEELLQQVPPRGESMSLPPPQGDLKVELVTASAPGGAAPILRNVSFALPAGECLAVIGPSASGKTTLARLLMGLWPATTGKVRLDGADVYAWDKQELGPHVGYLPQGVELFDGTLAENIARFGVVDREKVEAAIRMVGLEAFVGELPEGLDSRIGEDGAFLSGGQRQRVGLARAVYGEPRFIVLDEPNSSLDEAGEAALMQLLNTLKERRSTVVIITHRPRILPAADCILLLHEGVVQAYGPRDEVLAALEKARLERLQRLGKAGLAAGQVAS